MSQGHLSIFLAHNVLKLVILGWYLCRDSDVLRVFADCVSLIEKGV